jgi:hypothetical protein
MPRHSDLREQRLQANRPTLDFVSDPNWQRRTTVQLPSRGSADCSRISLSHRLISLSVLTVLRLGTATLYFGG